MRTIRKLKALIITTAMPLLYVVGVSPDAPAVLTLLPAAHAVVGAPLTPVSAAGVARRTTRRVVVAEASTPDVVVQQQPAAAPRPPGAPAAGTVVTALPAGCRAEISGGVEYQNCGGVYYRAAFQGNNLVYVVQ